MRGIGSPRIAAICILLVAAAALAAYGYLFRTVEMFDRQMGVIYIRWRWGLATGFDVDSNRDGRIDYRMTVRNPEREISSHYSSVATVTESSKCDGTFDRHAVAGPDGLLAQLEVDEDGDGELERTLIGQAAVQYLREHPRSEACGLGLELTTPLPDDSR